MIEMDKNKIHFIWRSYLAVYEISAGNMTNPKKPKKQLTI
jgi:hypothetical protein